MERSVWEPEGIEATLAPDGSLRGEATTDAKALFKHLLAIRALDEVLSAHAGALSCRNEEAAIAAVAVGARAQDWVFPGPRDHAVAMIRELGLDQVAAAVAAGRSPGSTAHKVVPAARTLGASLALAAGCARGLSAQATADAKDTAVALALLGEGTTTTGGFHEALAAACAARSALVLVVRARQWPDDPPAEAGVLGDSVAERAQGYGAWATRADGADALGTWDAVQKAITRAARGDGPCIVEVAISPAKASVPADRDPIERLRTHLKAAGQWTRDMEDVIVAQVRSAVRRELQAAGIEIKGDKA